MWIIFLLSVSDTLLPANDTSYIIIKGQNSFSYQGKYLLSGNNPPNFYPYKMRDNLLTLNISGILKGKVRISGDVMQGKTREYNHLLLGLTGRHFHLQFGDIDASLGGLIMKDKSIMGIKGGITYSKIKGEGFYSTPKGISYIERMNGDETQGPYQLTYSPVIINSERVRVGEGLNLHLLQKGKDYRIDYSSGRITFIDRIIKEDETIEVSYEYLPEGNLSPFGGGRVVITPFPHFSFGGSHIKGGSSSIEMGYTTKILGLGIEGAEDKDKNRAYKARGNLNLERLKISSWITQVGDTFNIIGKGIERGREWEIKGIFTPMDVFTITSGYSGRNTDREVDFSGRWKTIGYSYRRYIGERPIIEHRLSIQEKFPKDIGIEIELGKEYKSEGKAYSFSGGISVKSFRFITLNTKGAYKRGDYREWENTSTISLSPSPHYQFSTTFTLRRSSYYHPSQRVIANYRISPFRVIHSNGRYSIETIRREVGTLDSISYESALTHTGAFSVNLNPFQWINFAYKPNFVFTEGIETHIRSYSSFRNLFELVSKPHKSLLAGYSKEFRDIYALNRENQKSADAKDNNQMIRIRFSPLPFLSLSGDIIDKYGKGLYRVTYPTPTDTAGDTISLYKERREKTITPALDLRFKDRSSLRFSYRRRKYYERIPDSLLTNTITHKITGRAGKYFTDIFNIYNEVSYERKYGQDPYISLTDTNLFIQTLSYEVGFNIIPIQGIRGRFSYTLSQSFNDADTREEDIQGALNSSLSFLDAYLLLKYKKSLAPDFRTLEFTLRVNIRF